MEPAVDPAALHQPVLPHAVVELLSPAPGRRYLDCTLGLGGHAERLLAAGASVVGVDRDPRARQLAAGRLAPHGARFELRAGTFAAAAEGAAAAGERFAGVLADLGVSSLQLDDAGRGFSFRSEARADMRMGEGCGEDAVGLIGRLDEEGLAAIIWRYGEERLSRRIARSLKRALAAGATSGAELAAAVRAAVPGHHARHPAQRTFQALRIAVNDELGELDRLLAVLPRLVVDGGAAVVISFHSLEDRAVKLAFRAQAAAGEWSEIARRPLVADEQETAANPRAGSAKLRWARRPGIAA